MLEGFRERKLDVTVALQELSDIAGGLGAKSLKERLDRDLVKKMEEDRFHLVVVGEFNHGKSSFVNALLGETVLPVGVTPTTAAIHHLKYAETPESTVVYSSGRRESIPFGDTRKFAVGGGTAADDVDYLEVGYPAALLKERILLVDTPGVNDLSLQRADITYSYIPRADAVLFLLDAGQILKESERQFLNEKLLKASRDKIVFVITKWDILNEDEKKEALAYARTQLANLVKDPVVFPISAETALQGGNMAASGMPELLAHLTTFLAEERGRILLDNALGEGLNVSNLLAKGVDARRRSLAMKTDELERRIKMLEEDLAGAAGTIEQRRVKIREEISGIKVGAQKDLERFIEETIRQLPNVIDSAKREDLRKFLPAFLQDTFQQWAEAEGKEIGGKLEALAEKTIALIKEDANDATKRVAQTLGHEVKKLDVQIDTFKYDAGVAAVLLVGIGTAVAGSLMIGAMIALLGAPALALFVRDRVDAEYKKQAKEQAPDVIRAAGKQVGPKVDEMIEDFAKKLDTWVVTAGEELYREVLEVLNAAHAVRKKGDQTDEAILAEVNAQDARLAKAKTRVEELRATLWGPKDKVRVADAAVSVGEGA
ncbi:MAG TPA: dynamin family protein [Labilithrix sp.]|jgi:small GTP-binding protein|nr:dynamin family protein [Labilithrix sp.]